MNITYNNYLSLIENYLSQLFSGDEKLYEAMRYSLLSGGKRVRPVLTLAFCELCGGKPEDALAAACAIELIHTYSLIHDDLPCLDNDDTRRGKPANHIKYGEAMALLAGDGLLSYAFVLAQKTPQAADEIAVAAFDMVRGQALEFDGCEDTRVINRYKTGALFIAAAKAGCLAASGNASSAIEAAGVYAGNLGLAFQYRDDLLDGERGDGVDRVKEIKRCTDTAKNALKGFENNDFLIELADKLSNRDT
ncbi:MAG: polyprenyl synthetase family protein [Oscillospiraceae bacterium]|nr:polyprenyl synthetase family protein [Oscillospiraceae bacterium]